MALKRGTEVATIDCSLVTIKPDSGTEEFAIDTANKVSVAADIETVNAVKLIIKGKLKAQKREQSVLTGHTITLSDNVFIPEVVKVLQGGTIVFDDTDPTKIISYTPPVVGSAVGGQQFTTCLYTARYDASGEIIGYEKVEYPNCKGKPIALSNDDTTFRANEYTISSAPAIGEAPYTMTYVEVLPAVT